jgi:hypothetical protein
VFRHLSNI